MVSAVSRRVGRNRGVAGAAEQVLGGGDPKVSEHGLERRRELALQARGVGGQDLVEAGEGGHDPEERFAVVAAVGEALACVDGDQSGQGSDVAAEEERRPGGDGRHVEGPGELVQVLLDRAPLQPRTAQQLQQPRVAMGLAVVGEHSACRRSAAARWGYGVRPPAARGW